MQAEFENQVISPIKAGAQKVNPKNPGRESKSEIQKTEKIANGKGDRGYNKNTGYR